MYYLSDPGQIKNSIDDLAEAPTLWIDTEVADYHTKNPKLSLISVLAYSQDLNGNRTYILDVLDRPELAAYFIEKIMAEPQIEKVFHNAKYDLKFLGKSQARNVLCTLETAKKIPYHLLPIPNLKLKTLVEYLTDFSPISKKEQGSDWGQRPLRQSQLDYVKMEPVYLAQIYQRLQYLVEKNTPNPLAEDLQSLELRYRQIEEKWRLLDSEINFLKERIRNAMQAQNLQETSTFKLSISERKTVKIDFYELANKAVLKQLDLHFPVILNEELRSQLGTILSELNLQEDRTQVLRLTAKTE